MARIQDIANYVNDYKQIHTNGYNTTAKANHHHHLKSPAAVIDMDQRHFSVATPTKLSMGRQSETPLRQDSVAAGESGATWNWSFCIVSLPFILFGFPIHLVFGSTPSGDDESSTNGGAGKGPDITTTRAWLQSIFVPFNCLRILASLVLLPVAIGILTYNGYLIWNVIYNLVYLGEINTIVLSSGSEVLRILPIIIPLVLFWLYGHNVKNVMDSFNSIFTAFAKAFHNTWSRTQGKSPAPASSLPPTSFWWRLLRLYTAIFILHGIDLYMAITSGVFDGFDFEYHLVTKKAWFGFALEMMTSLVLPVYCMFCWVLHSELELLIGYLNLLVFYESEPNFTVFNEIKFLYKKVARQIMSVNKIFSKYLSALFVIVWTFAAGHELQAAFSFANYLTVMPVPPALPSELIGKDGVATMENMALANIAGLTDAQIQAAKQQAAVVMRETLGIGMIALLQMVLLLYTALQAIRVNKAARSLHVILNDFVTYNMSQDMTTELYHSFRLLKAFIHSAMERFEDPALLRIPILNYVPYLGFKLHSYELRF